MPTVGSSKKKTWGFDKMFSAMYVSQFELKYVDIAVKFGLVAVDWVYENLKASALDYVV